MNKHIEVGPEDVALIIKSVAADQYARQVVLAPSRVGNSKMPLSVLELMILALADKMEDQSFVNQLMQDYVAKRKAQHDTEHRTE